MQVFYRLVASSLGTAAALCWLVACPARAATDRPTDGNRSALALSATPGGLKSVPQAATGSEGDRAIAGPPVPTAKPKPGPATETPGAEPSGPEMPEVEAAEAEMAEADAVDGGAVRPERAESGPIAGNSPLETLRERAAGDRPAIPALASQKPKPADSTGRVLPALPGDRAQADDDDLPPLFDDLDDSDAENPEALPPLEADPPAADSPEADPLDAVPTPDAGGDAVPVPGAATTDAEVLELLERMEANPNPLQHPTLPEEVRLLVEQPLTLEQTLEIGRRNSLSLEEARLRLERSRAQLRQAIAANYPQLAIVNTNITRSLTASNRLGLLQQNLAQRRAGVPDPIDPDEQTNLTISAAVDLTYDIYTSGQRSANIEAARAQVRRDELAFEVAYEQLRFDLADSYYQLQQENAQLRIDQAAVRFREQAVEDARALEEAGLGTRFEVLQAESELANDRQTVVNTRNRLFQRQRDLARQLNLPQQVDVQVADPIGQAGEWGLSLEESIVLAYRNRAELEQLLVDRELNDAQRRAALAAIGPQLGFRARYDLVNQLDPEDDFGFVGGYALSLNFSWLLYDGGAARARARQEEIDIRLAENQFAQTQDNVRFEVEQAYSQLQTSSENIGTALSALESSREEERLARLRFQAGVGTQTDVLNAQTRLTRARGNLLLSIVSYNQALAGLQRAVTNLPPEAIEPLRNPVELPSLEDLDLGPQELPDFPGAPL